MPTVREIAEYADVSISTVSLVLNDKPGVSDQMRARVRQAAAELQDQEREIEDAPNGQKPLSIVVLHPLEFGDEVFSQSMQGIWAGIPSGGVQLQLVANAPHLLDRNNIPHLVFSDPALRPDGLMVLGAKREEALVEKALAMGIPCVLSQRETQAPCLSAVGVDEADGAYEATTHLIELGHRAIAFVGGQDVYTYTHGRLRGYRQAMAAHTLSVPDRWVALGWNDGAAMEKVLAESPEITGVVFINDGYALRWGLPVLLNAGYRIPDDISVVSFDNIKEAREFDPPITSISLPFYEISQRAVRVLLEQIRTPTLKSQHIRFNTTLKRRASSAPPRK
jgi:LacI family transcriptional regulator